MGGYGCKAASAAAEASKRSLRRAAGAPPARGAPAENFK